MPVFLEDQTSEQGEEYDPDEKPQYLMMNLDTNCCMHCQKCAEPGKGAYQPG